VFTEENNADMPDPEFCFNGERMEGVDDISINIVTIAAKLNR